MGVCPGIELVLAIVESVLTGTGISWPEAIIAFLLFVVKTTGRLMTLKRPDASSALTIAARPSRALLRRRVVPPFVTALARFDMLSSCAGSRMVAADALLRPTPAKLVSPG